MGMFRLFGACHIPDSGGCLGLFLHLEDFLCAQGFEHIPYPSPPRTYYLGTGALKGPLRAYYLGTWGARDSSDAGRLKVQYISRSIPSTGSSLDNFGSARASFWNYGQLTPPLPIGSLPV